MSRICLTDRNKFSSYQRCLEHLLSKTQMKRLWLPSVGKCSHWLIWGNASFVNVVLITNTRQKVKYRKLQYRVPVSLCKYPLPVLPKKTGNVVALLGKVLETSHFACQCFETSREEEEKKTVSSLRSAKRCIYQSEVEWASACSLKPLHSWWKTLICWGLFSV